MIKYGYRIMMTERCELPETVSMEPGCTDGFSEAPYLINDIVYDTLEDAEEVLKQYRSIKSGYITDSSFNRMYSAREFYIEKIKVGEYERKLKSYGAVKYAQFESFEKGREPIFCTEPPEVIKWCHKKNYCGPVEENIVYKNKRRKKTEVKTN